MLPSQTRLIIVAAKLLIVSLGLAAGSYFLPFDNSWSYVCISAWGLFGLLWLCGRSARGLAARWRFKSRIRKALPLAGTDLARLTAVATAIKRGQEDHAFFLLEGYMLRSQTPQATDALRWLKALAGVRWMSRQRPVRPLSGFHERFPQLHALIFCYGTLRLPIRLPLVTYELSVAPPAEVDALAQRYVSLVDVLVAALGDPDAPFADDAEELLEFMTGRAYMLGARERFTGWWARTRPVVVRGGGALLVGLRLMQHEAYQEAAQYLTRLAEDGMLSVQTEALRSSARFLALFARPQWRMTSADMPRYFFDGFYYLASDMGVLRYPTAELPEIVACCRHADVLQAAKKRLIEDALDLWEIFSDELSTHLALLLKRLLQHKGRHCPSRLSYWREQWAERQGAFERPVTLLMRGIVATADREFTAARRLFEEVARLEPQSSLALVNLVHVHLATGHSDQARALVEEIQKHHPRDGQAMIALGRLLVQHADDTAAAEKLFQKALDCAEAPIEALTCMAEVKLLQGMYIEAHDYFSQAMQLDPALPDAKLGLARVYLETKRFDLAVEQLRAIAGEGSTEAQALANYLLYRTYREMGDDSHAVACLDRVPRSFFHEPEILDDIAVHLESGKFYAKAREFAERAMVLRATGQWHNDDADALSSR